ncbi:hypothetical protein C8F04DRAFT_1017845 [Mycena alexandri]|uniref:AB hydrolase-1 domain-containing protein n=1 Tax=Mycena alexandri TaxID=1745969 RepID=A0AAD6RYQ1_9AGAR|nr:hypothetical protein C8F04DRAFT_1017845 [Mycena alexandri]
MALLSISLSLLIFALPAWSRAISGPLKHRSGDPWYPNGAPPSGGPGWPWVTVTTVPQPPQQIKWVDCHERIPTTVQATTNITASTPLPPNLCCGELVVPMDYSKLISADNNITVGFAMVRPPKGTNSSGLIAYHAGGPGIDAATKAWETAFNQSTTFLGLEDFDLLMMNTRGLEFSTPLNITSGVFFNDPLINHPFPTNETQYAAYQSAMTNFLMSVNNNTTPAGLMEHVSTNEIIQDMDALRGALGYQKLHFAGVSYGTFVGAAYADRFPDRVGPFVIDAVIPHGMPFQEMIDHQMTAINRLILRSDAFCMTDPACPFHGQGQGAVVKAWDTLLAQTIKNGSIPAPSCGTGQPFNGGAPCNTPVTATDLRFGVHASFRSDSDFPLFNLGVHQALNGNASLLAYQPLEDVRETVVSPLLCSDFPIDDSEKNFDGFNQFALNSQANDTHSVIYSQTWQFVLMCAAWPFKVANQTTLKNDLEIMWVTSDYDLNLPTELTTFAWEQTPNASLVIRHGDVHTSIDFTGTPAGAAADLAKGFLKTGIMPGAQANDKVTVIAPGGTRGPVPDPYEVATGLVAADTSVVENITTSSNPIQNTTETLF